MTGEGSGLVIRCDEIAGNNSGGTMVDMFNGCVLDVLTGMLQCEVHSRIVAGDICEERVSSSAAFSSFWRSGSREGQALPLTSALRCSEAGITYAVAQDASGHGHHSTPFIFVSCRTRRSRKVSGAFSNSGAYGMGQPRWPYFIRLYSLRWYCEARCASWATHGCILATLD